MERRNGGNKYMRVEIWLITQDANGRLRIIKKRLKEIIAEIDKQCGFRTRTKPFQSLEDFGRIYRLREKIKRDIQ